MILTVSQSIRVRRHLSLHRDGNKNVGRLSYLNSKKSAPRHSHNRHGSSLHNQLLVQNSGITAELALPVPVAQYHYRVRARRGFILRIEDASECRGHAERFKVISTYKFSVCQLGVSLTRNARLYRKSCEQAGEDLVVIAQIFVHRIQPRRASVAVAPISARLRSGSVQHNQLLGILDRQETQEHLVGDGKYCSIRADAQSQRQDCNDRKSWTLRQHSQRIAQVLQ